MSRIKNLAIDDRPREKLLIKGVQTLSDSELLAIIIGSGSKEDSAVELARKILHSVDNNLNKLGDLLISELIKHKGIGQAKAVGIVAALELGKRRKKNSEKIPSKFTYSKEVYEFVSGFISSKQEEFWLIAVSNAKNFIDKKLIGIGGIDNVSVDIRIIMTFLLKSGATAFFICHNHLSGNLEPSKEDIEITGNISQAAQIMNLTLIDHLITSERNYFSFADNNLLRT